MQKGVETVMVTIAICDDNQMDIDKISNILNEWANISNNTQIQIKSFTSPYQLVESVSNGESYDIFLLDILMPEMSGISLGEQLQNMLIEPLLIYLTYSADYYADAFRIYAFQYICKPVQKDNLFPVLEKAFIHLEKRKNEVFLLKTSEGVVSIPLQQIVYVELLSHFCHFHLEDGKILKSLYIRTAFNSFIAPLLIQDRFVMTHVSFVANLNFARTLSRTALIMTTGASIPITRSFASQVQKLYMTYGLRKGDELL